MFRRRRAEDDVDDELDVDELDDDENGDEDDPGRTAAEIAAAADVGGDVERAGRPEGPWDVDDAPVDELLDLGGLRVPVVDGFDISVTADNDVPVVVTYAARDSMMQVHAFAAPKSAGIWDQVRAEIAESVVNGGGRAEDIEGAFGPELRAQLPAQKPDGSQGLEPARFVGIDGPRWFLRALISGPATSDARRSGEFDAVLRRIVVCRGVDAMAPRDIIPLRLPRETPVVEHQDVEHQDVEHRAKPRIQLPQRGPEITETR